jgi:chromosome segregation ATPase
MANPILKIKRGSGAPVSLAVGELAIDQLNKSLFVGTADGPLPVGGEHVFAKKTFVSDAVEAEADLREAADASIVSDLAAEVSRATAAEGTLTTNLASEVSRATAAETALGTRIDNVLSNVDPEAIDSHTEVVAAFEAADDNLNGAITSLAESASSNLAAETAAREAADAALASDISDIETAATALTSRVSAAEGDITSLESDLASAVSDLESSIAAEAATRGSADTSLGNRITALETEIDGGVY